MICPRTGGARDQVLPVLLPADKAVPDAGGLVDALEAVPVSIRHRRQRRAEAVHVVALVTAVAQQQRVLVLPAVAQLAEGLHDGLVPRDGGLQHVEADGQLRRSLRLPHPFPPGQEAPRQVALLLVLPLLLVVLVSALVSLAAGVQVPVGGRVVAVGHRVLVVVVGVLVLSQLLADVQRGVGGAAAHRG